MKTITKLIIGMLLFSVNYAQAQNDLASADVSGNKEAKSSYVDVRYYYYPNLQAYFDTKVGMYLFEQNGEWVESEKLETTFRGYSLKNGQYVMIEDYSGEEPYLQIDEHKAQYPPNYSSRPKRDVASN